MSDAPDKVRVDKWLWAVRVFKTRSLAAEACKGGKVKVAGKNAKPALALKAGDELTVSRGGLTRTLRVANPIEKRVGAKIAVDCYEDLTPEETYEEFRKSRSADAVGRDRGTGRPTKRDRRETDRMLSGLKELGYGKKE